MNLWRPKGARAVYRGWWALLGATLLAVLSGGALYHGATVFFKPIQRDLGLSSASAALVFTLARAQASIAAPLYGWLADRVGAKPLIALGALVSGLGLIVITRIESYALFLLAYLLLVSAPSSFGFGQTLLTAVNGWFIRRKAIAMSILLTGMAAGGAVFVYPLGVGVDRFGWRPTSVASGLLVIVGGLALSALVAPPPRGAGSVVERVEGEPSHAPRAGRAAPRAADADFALSEAIRARVFWILLAASTLRIASETAIGIHIVPIMAWQGAEEEFAAALVSVYFLLSIPFRLGLGLAAHRLGFQPPIVCGMLCGAAACALLIQTDDVRSLYPFALLLAIYEGSAALQWVALGNYFGRRSYGAITGIIRAFDTVGTFFAPWFAGWAFDRTGGYTPALAAFAAAFAIAALLYGICRRPSRPVPRRIRRPEDR